MNNQQNIGFIGLGVMGEPMCRNLSTKPGLKLRAFDRREEPLTRLAQVGVTRADSLAEMATAAILKRQEKQKAFPRAMVTGVFFC